MSAAVQPEPAPSRPSFARSAWRACRPHQWTKNLLVLVAVVISHRYGEWRQVAHAAWAAVLFGLAASSVYLVNDAIDLEADRRHPAKKTRPLAAGELSIRAAVAIAVLLGAMALAGASLLGQRLVLLLGLYLAVSSVYSLWVKELLMVDVVVLACLYVVRVMAGGLAIGIWLSFWTLAFSLFFFFSLALAKRYSELYNRPPGEAGPGRRRAYRKEDLAQINLLGVASGVVAVLIVGLYIDGPDVRQLYGHPALLWFLCPLLLAWSGRLWILAGRGELTEDPVAFALRDRYSYVIGVLAALVGMAAT